MVHFSPGGPENPTAEHIDSDQELASKRVLDVVLLIDDVPALAHALRRTLSRRLGVSLVDSCEPLRAVELVREYRPRVVLVDYLMPEISGVSVVRGLRASFPDLIIGALSGSMTDKISALCIEAGANWTLVKGDVEPLIERLVECGARVHEYSLPTGMPFDDVKKVVFRQEVEAQGGNISAAARALQVDRNTLKRALDD